MATVNEIIDMMIVLRESSEKYYRLIREEIERGNFAEARDRLSIIDLLIEARKSTEK